MQLHPIILLTGIIWCSNNCVNLNAVLNVFYWVFLVCLYILAMGMGIQDQQLRKTTL